MFSAIFFIVWGLMFAGFPLVFFVSSIIKGTFEVINFTFIPFMVFGTVVVVLGVKKIVRIVKRRTIKLFGKKALATFVASEENPKENSFSFAAIVSFKDSAGNVVERKTEYKYTPEDIDYFISKKKFHIRYDKFGNIVIVDEPNVFKHIYNSISSSLKNQETHTMNQIEYYCPYCKGKQGQPGKCNNCGANVEERNF